MAKISGKYEIVYIIDPAQGEEGIAALVEKFKAFPNRAGSSASTSRSAKNRFQFICIASFPVSYLLFYHRARRLSMAALHNSARAFGERFFVEARFEKCRNTLCISNFSNRWIGKK